MPADVVTWPLGTASTIAGFWILLWFLGRPLLKLLKIIGSFLRRVALAIQRFFQPIFEFIYRSFYTLMQLATAGLLGWVAATPFLQGVDVEMLPQIEAGVAAFMANHDILLAGKLQGDLISHCEANVRNVVENAKQLARTKVFEHPRKVELEIGAYEVISTLLNGLIEAAVSYARGDDTNYRHLRIIDLIGKHSFPPALRELPEQERIYESIVRTVDFLSGMTDNYATYLAKQFAGMAETPVTAERTAAAAASPRIPHPRTATTAPSRVPGTVTPHRIPAPIGLNATATSGASVSGIGSNIESGPRYWCVAYPPQSPGERSMSIIPYMSARPCSLQRRYSPPTHAGQVRHDWKHSTATRSPATTPHRSDARGPISLIRPTASWPGTNAKPGAMAPV